MGSFECACDELSEEVLEAAKSFKFGNEDLQEGGAFIVSVGVKISRARIAEAGLGVPWQGLGLDCRGIPLRI